MQITVTLELTPRNLALLDRLCAPEMLPVPSCLGNSEPAEQCIEAAPPKESRQASDANPVNAVKGPSTADVKAVCLKFSKAGRQAELKAAFAKFGAKKLTEINEADYTALLEELGDD